MKVQILGSGCDKCRKLTSNVADAAAKLGLACEIEKVTDIDQITGFGVMMTPALVVDGKVVSVGKVLSPDEAAAFLAPNKACSCKTSTDNSSPDEKSCKCNDGSQGGSCGCSTGSESNGCGCSPQKTSTCACGGTGSAKKILTVLLLLFVVSSVAYTVFREVRRGGLNGKSGTAAASKNLQVKSDVLVVYYFHGTQRCMTCNKIEALAQTAISSKFAKEMADGTVVFRSVNLDEPVNEHFIADFQLASRTVVMQKNGKHEKFDSVWTLVREPEKFASYLQEGAAKLMEAKK